MCHLKVSVDDRCLALVQARHGVAGVAKDLKHLRLCEARLQPLIHQINNLAPCKIIICKMQKQMLSISLYRWIDNSPLVI